ncbi:MAG: hypothetical protein CBE00_05480 [Planctomycetaceae bacterium TMED240]|nr:MAG: hypothetical protein CBE00_05480 [Planctomycetaceae bacterium TMED240]
MPWPERISYCQKTSPLATNLVTARCDSGSSQGARYWSHNETQISLCDSGAARSGIGEVGETGFRFLLHATETLKQFFFCF